MQSRTFYSEAFTLTETEEVDSFGVGWLVEQEHPVVARIAKFEKKASTEHYPVLKSPSYARSATSCRHRHRTFNVNREIRLAAVLSDLLKPYLADSVRTSPVRQPTFGSGCGLLHRAAFWYRQFLSGLALRQSLLVPLSLASCAWGCRKIAKEARS